MIDLDLESKIAEVVDFFGFILYDVDFLKESGVNILRVSITHPSEPVALEICQKISEALSPLLDVEFPYDQQYFLEVGSKGLERTLKKFRHFELSVGDRLDVRLKDKSTFKAILMGVKNDEVFFELDSGDIKEVRLEDIKRAKTFLEK